MSNQLTKMYWRKRCKLAEKYLELMAMTPERGKERALSTAQHVAYAIWKEVASKEIPEIND